jgi:hypothetical protein
LGEGNAKSAPGSAGISARETPCARLVSFKHASRAEMPALPGLAGCVTSVIKKEEVYYYEREGKLKRRNKVSKNEHLRAMFETCIRNRLEFRYVLFDS